MITTDKAFVIMREKVRSQLIKGGSGFRDVSNLLLKSEGKYLRTKMGLICSADKNGLVDESVTDKLAAVELLHLATLIHDDVIDSAYTRRGFPSVQAAFGKHGAVIAGDFILTRCFSLISDCNQKQRDLFLRAVSAVCKGEMLQEQSLFDRSITPMRYLRTISGKTAALFSLSAAVGRNDFVTLSLGHKFGMIYQIYDDIRDFTGDNKAFGGKPTMNDFKSGVITLPAIYCLLKDPRLSDDKLIQGIEYGIVKSKELAGRYLTKLYTLIDRANINNPDNIDQIIYKIIQ